MLRRGQNLLYCLLCGLLALTAPSIANECPNGPPATGCWTLEQFQKAKATLMSLHYTCCCLTNVLGDHTTLGPYGPVPGCEYPPEDGVGCSQTWEYEFQSVIPESSEDAYMPWNTSISQYPVAWTHFECTCSNGFRYCAVETQYVAMRMTSCVQCP